MSTDFTVARRFSYEDLLEQMIERDVQNWKEPKVSPWATQATDELVNRILELDKKELVRAASVGIAPQKTHTLGAAQRTGGIAFTQPLGIEIAEEPYTPKITATARIIANDMLAAGASAAALPQTRAYGALGTPAHAAALPRTTVQAALPRAAVYAALPRNAQAVALPRAMQPIALPRNAAQPLALPAISLSTQQEQTQREEVLRRLMSAPALKHVHEDVNVVALAKARMPIETPVIPIEAAPSKRRSVLSLYAQKAAGIAAGLVLTASAMSFTPFTRAEYAPIRTAPVIVRAPAASELAANGILSTYPLPSQKEFLTSWYGTRRVSRGSRVHRKIDLRAKEDDPVVAVAPGYVVAKSEKAGPNGLWIKIRSQGFTHQYLHVDPKNHLKPGSYVNEGDTIAVIASRRRTTWPEHLDLKMEVEGVPVNAYCAFTNPIRNNLRANLLERVKTREEWPSSFRQIKDRYTMDGVLASACTTQLPLMEKVVRINYRLPSYQVALR